MSMTPNQPAPPAPSRRPPGPGLALSLLVGALGIVIGIVAVVAIIIPFADVFRSDEYGVPGTIHVNLEHERYTVYQRDIFGAAFGSRGLSPEMLTVTAPDRSTVPVAYSRHNETIDRGGGEFRSALEFEPPSSGDYTLEFTNPVPTEVVIARSIEDVVRGVLVWFGVGAVGGAVLLAGIVMLVIGVTRRGRAKRAAYAAWGPPGGAWYQVNPPQQWAPPSGAPGYPPSGYAPPQYPQQAYPPRGYGQPGAPGYPPPPPAYPPSAYPPPPAPAPEAPSAPEPSAPPAPAPEAPSAPEPAAPPADESDQPNP
jgi:hypothetical protein